MTAFSIPTKNGTYLADCRSNVAQVAIQIRKGAAYWGEKFDRPVPMDVLAKVKQWRRIRFARQGETEAYVQQAPLVKLPCNTHDSVVEALNAAGVPWQIDPLSLLREEFKREFGGTLFKPGGEEKAFSMFCRVRGTNVQAP